MVLSVSSSLLFRSAARATRAAAVPLMKPVAGPSGIRRLTASAPAQAKILAVLYKVPPDAPPPHALGRVRRDADDR